METPSPLKRPGAQTEKEHTIECPAAIHLFTENFFWALMRQASAWATRFARLGGLQSNLTHRMPALENASAIVGKCPELLSPPAPCPRMMPVLAVDVGASTVAVYVSALPDNEYSSIGMG